MAAGVALAGLAAAACASTASLPSATTISSVPTSGGLSSSAAPSSASPPLLTCFAAPSKSRPRVDTTVVIHVSTAPHAHVTGTGLGARHASRADAAGDRALRFWVGAATPGVRAVVHVHVAQHGQKASCKAVLRPRPVAPIPPPPSAAPQPVGCYPRTDGGNCYQPGEFCRASDHGASGIDGDGDPIVCEDNNGWRWEPA